ncbi:serine carboxypeptidase [Teladorsagia circumcincta]|uniref:Serine carboxypeptidase n=1 Tax=Teladorsagia circumcincta TaxID=45464 RepID=A0A2G9UGA4_TELCI|nr:serine carboxypeptidase [Teladorsagia circumcincta]
MSQPRKKNKEQNVFLVSWSSFCKGNRYIASSFIALLLITTQCICATPIENLPGTPSPDFEQHSGYFDVGAGKKLFYWFVESQNNATTDPIVLWLSGGPGCSGVASLLTEWGPFMSNDDGETLRTNPYAWNKYASVLTMDAPAGVGYSYTADGNITSDDDQVC